MIYEKLICIDSDNEILKVNKIYISKKSSFGYNLINIFEINGKSIGLFPERIFITVKQYRNDRLNEILNDI